METPKTQRPAGSSRPTSRSLVSESRIKEIIACLWSLMWVILWVNHAPQWMLWVVGLKAASDHLRAVIFAIKEIRSENRFRWASPSMRPPHERKNVPESGRERLRSDFGDAIRIDNDEIKLQRETSPETDEQRNQDITQSLRERASDYFRKTRSIYSREIQRADSGAGVDDGGQGTLDVASIYLAQAASVAVGRKRMRFLRRVPNSGRLRWLLEQQRLPNAPCKGNAGGEQRTCPECAEVAAKRIDNHEIKLQRETSPETDLRAVTVALPVSTVSTSDSQMSNCGAMAIS